jgi:hypothetical protein
MTHENRPSSTKYLVRSLDLDPAPPTSTHPQLTHRSQSRHSSLQHFKSKELLQDLPTSLNSPPPPLPPHRQTHPQQSPSPPLHHPVPQPRRHKHPVPGRQSSTDPFPARALFPQGGSAGGRLRLWERLGLVVVDQCPRWRRRDRPCWAEGWLWSVSLWKFKSTAWKCSVDCRGLGGKQCGG